MEYKNTYKGWLPWHIISAKEYSQIYGVNLRTIYSRCSVHNGIGLKDCIGVRKSVGTWLIMLIPIEKPAD